MQKQFSVKECATALGPLLYSIYANNLPLQAKHCQMHSYTYVVVLVMPPLTIRLINQVLNRNYFWAFANGLSINPNISMALLIRASENLIANLNRVNGSNIGFVRTAESLVVTLSKELNWSNHVKMKCEKTFTMIQNLWMLQYFTPTNIRILLAKTHLLLTLMYGTVMLMQLVDEDLM